MITAKFLSSTRNNSLDTGIFLYLISLVGERLLHLGALLLASSQAVVIEPLELSELPLPHLLLLFVDLEISRDTLKIWLLNN